MTLNQIKWFLVHTKHDINSSNIVMETVCRCIDEIKYYEKLHCIFECKESDLLVYLPKEKEPFKISFGEHLRKAIEKEPINDENPF